MVVPALSNGPKVPKYPLLKTSLTFMATLVADLVYCNNFDDAKIWNRCVGVYMDPWIGEEQGVAFAESIRNHYHAIERVCGPCISFTAI